MHKTRDKVFANEVRKTKVIHNIFADKKSQYRMQFCITVLFQGYLDIVIGDRFFNLKVLRW